MLMLTQKRQVRVDEYYCSECDEWIRAESTWCCEGCASRFCVEEEPVVVTEDGIKFCDACVKRFNKDIKKSPTQLYD